MNYTTYPYGEAAIYVEFSKKFTQKAWLYSHALAEYLLSQNVSGILNVIPTYASIVISYNIELTSPSLMRKIIEDIVEDFANKGVELERKTKKYSIPVRYGDEYGPDLKMITELVGVSEKEIIKMHTQNCSQVICFTSPAGQPLLNQSLLPDIITRKSIPHTNIPKGSIGAVGDQTVIYSRNTPGGWPIIGQTPINIIQPETMPPTFLRPGDLICFFEIQSSDWKKYENKNIKDLQVN